MSSFSSNSLFNETTTTSAKTKEKREAAEVKDCTSLQHPNDNLNKEGKKGVIEKEKEGRKGPKEEFIIRI